MRSFQMLFAFAALLLAIHGAQAEELRDYYLGARATAMGGAYVGLADDEQAIFLNPAGLAGNERQVLQYGALSLSASQEFALSAREGIDAFSNLNGDTIDAMMGKDFFAQAQYAPSLMIPNLGFALLSDAQFSLNMRNKSYPDTTLGYQTTNGIQVAYGFQVGRSRRGKDAEEFRLGIGAKVMWRRGGYRDVPLLTLLTIDEQKVDDLVGPWGRGIGVDLGAQYVNHISSRLTVSGGMAFTNIGDLSFGSRPDPIKNNLTLGVAGKYDFGYTALTLAYDYSHILANADWRMKNHLGLQFDLPMIEIYGGLNQGGLTYGARFDLWMFRVTAYTYREQLGALKDLQSTRRWTLSLDLLFLI